MPTMTTGAMSKNICREKEGQGNEKTDDGDESAASKSEVVMFGPINPHNTASTDVALANSISGSKSFTFVSLSPKS